jgi:VanZ family protein
VTSALWRLAFGAGLLLVAVMSLLPPDRLPQSMSLSDKAVHALAYALLGALAVLSGLTWRGALVSVVGFGLLLEIAQGVSGHRSFEGGDLLADAVGAGIGVVVVIAVVRRPRRGLPPGQQSAPGSSRP